MTVPPVRGVIVDMDDTLYPQASWLAGAFDRTAAAYGELGGDASSLRRALDVALAAGSDRGDTIDRALRSMGHPAVGADAVEPLVAAFRSYVPDRLDPYDGVEESLSLLAAHVPLALVSDGDPPGQRGKLDALGLGRYFTAVVFSDELGRAMRKPHPAGMLAALAALALEPDEVVVVGDRPDKDVAAAHAAGMRAIRVRTGEYADRVDLEGTWASAASFAEATERLLPLLATAEQSRT